MLAGSLLLLCGCPEDDDDFSDDDTADDDTSDDDTADDDTADDDTADDDTADDDTADDDTGDDDTGDDDTTPPPNSILEFVPASLAFGIVDVGTTNVQTVTINELAGFPATLTSSVFNGGNWDQFTADDLTGVVIAASGSLQVDVTYQPTDAGVHYADFVVYSDGLTPELHLPLSGTALWNPKDTDDDLDGVTENQGDCDDTDDQIYPGAVERCNGLDDNCDGIVPPDETQDNDNDGLPMCADCHDFDPDMNDDDDDFDGYSTCDGDCDDGDYFVNPGAPERCNGLDDDCDGIVPTDEQTDADGDQWAVCADCDDADPAIHPGQKEIPGDGIDQNCDGYDK